MKLVSYNHHALESVFWCLFPKKRVFQTMMYRTYSRVIPQFLSIGVLVTFIVIFLAIVRELSFYFLVVKTTPEALIQPDDVLRMRLLGLRLMQEVQHYCLYLS